MSPRAYTRRTAAPLPVVRALVRELVDRYLEELVRKGMIVLPVTASRLSKPKPRARERIDFLTETLRNSPPAGIPLAEAISIIEKHQGRKIRPEGLQEFIRRYAAYHQMVVLKGRLRMQTEKVLAMLRKVG